MNEKAARLNFERKLFLVPFGLGILIAIYGLVRLGHGPFPFAATRVLRIVGGITVAAASWILSSRRRAANLRFERKLFLVPFGLGILIAVYALLRLGHGPSPFGQMRIIKLIAGTAIATMSWFFGSERRVRNTLNCFLRFWLEIQTTRKSLHTGIEAVAIRVSQYPPVSNLFLKFQNKQKNILKFLYVMSKLRSQENLKRAFLFWAAFSAGLLWLGPFSNYSPPGFLDPWIDTGYFTNFHYLVNRFGLLYYVSRLPYEMFGVLMYKIFSPLAANYLINVTILTADTFSLYAILLRHTGRWVAVVTTIALACNPYLIGTVTWDYPDGPAIAFLLLGFWMVLAPPRRFEGRLATVWAGAFWAMAGYTILIAGLIIIPGVLILFYVKRANLREAVKQCAWLAVGVALVTVAFGLISLAVFHTFAFWMPQWNLYRYVTTTPGYLAHMWGTGLGWILTSYRLAATYGLTLIGTIFAARHFHKIKKDRFFTLALLLLLLSDIVFAFVEFGMKAVVLRVFYTSSYLVVPAFIFLGALLSALYKVVEGQERVWLRVACGAVLAGIALSLFAVRSLALHWSTLPPEVWISPELVRQVWILLSALSISGVIGFSWVGWARRIGITVAAFSFALLISFSTSMDLHYVFLNTRLEFKAAMATQDLLKSGILNDHPVVFWYDNDERWSRLYNSINSLYLWGWRDLTRELPTMTVEDLRGLVPPDTVFIHLTTVPAKMPERVRLLSQRNLRVEDIGRWTVQRGNVEFEVYAQHVLNAAEVK
ncbi:MAG TPA: hypothetical protein VK699_14170 [Terriglobales bacterium]|jgi:hypothetical protein|nr:hypothetical protein [Terriglobales bacterium]